LANPNHDGWAKTTRYGLRDDVTVFPKLISSHSCEHGPNPQVSDIKSQDSEKQQGQHASN